MRFPVYGCSESDAPPGQCVYYPLPHGGGIRIDCRVNIFPPDLMLIDGSIELAQYFLRSIVLVHWTEVNIIIWIRVYVAGLKLNVLPVLDLG
jgi:hypothetical protein